MTDESWPLGRRGVLVLALAAVAAGVVLVWIALAHQQSAPHPHDAGALPGDTSSSGAGAAPLGPSRPMRISIPSLKISSVVNPIGQNADGSLAVPQPGPRLNQAAWYVNSPTPGQLGPSIIEGHVDSPSGPSVFFRLGAIRPGALIRVVRADGVRLQFTVRAVRDFSKATFPTRVVYGGDLSTPGLRLITCSDFNETTHHHEGNEVVYAELTHRS